MITVSDWKIEGERGGIALSTAPDNVKAQSLYEKEGYVKDDEFYNYFLAIVQES